MNETHGPEVVTADPILSVSGRMYDKIPYDAGPQWGIGEMAKTFFDRTSHWVRWLESNRRGKADHLVLDGKPVGRRKDPGGVRTYGLRDIEDIAYALASNGRLDGTRLRSILLALFHIGEIHGLQTQGFAVISDGEGWRLSDTTKIVDEHDTDGDPA